MSKPTDREILEWASDQNLKHMHEGAAIEMYFDWIFLIVETLPSGQTRESVRTLTSLQQIKLLEHLVADEKFSTEFRRRCEGRTDSMHMVLGELAGFLEEIDKRGFRSGDDHDFPSCPTCSNGGRVGPSAVGGTYYCYECCGTF